MNAAAAVEDFEALIQRQCDDVIEQLTAEYGQPLCGTTRAVFMLPDGESVLKVPRNEAGFTANVTEALHRGDFIPLADCELVTGPHDMPLLRMQRVTPVNLPSDQWPDWLGWVDCQQAGYTADGRLVAYDL